MAIDTVPRSRVRLSAELALSERLSLEYSAGEQHHSFAWRAALDVWYMIAVTHRQERP